MSHTVNDLRAALFAQLDNLRNPTRDVEVEVSRARAMSEVGRTILESAKLEIEHARMLGNQSVDFLGGGMPAVERRENGTIIERRGNVLRHTAT